MKRVTMLLLPVLVILFVFSGCGCDHVWADATCNAPKTCTLCQETEGIPLEHLWQDASCIAPKTCSLCSITDGDALPHTPGDLKTETDYVRAVSVETLTCSVCDAAISSVEAELSLVDNGLFLLSGENFVARLNNIYNSLGKTNWHASLEYFTHDGNSSYNGVIRHDDVIYARFFLYADETDPDTTQIFIPITESQKKEQIITQTQIFINYYEIAEQLYDMKNSDKEQQTRWILDTFDQSETIFRDVLNPIYMTLDSSLAEDEIDSAVQTALESTYNFYSTNLVHQSQCGELYPEFINLFSVMGGYVVNISPTSDHWTTIQPPT